MSLEFLQKAEDVGHGKLTFPPVNQLNRLPALKIDAASAASAAPSWKISTKCSGDLAPPEAITGTVTALEIAAVSATSKPLRVPSRSTEVSRISPAPAATPIRAQSMASRDADSRPPRTMTSQ